MAKWYCAVKAEVCTQVHINQWWIVPRHPIDTDVHSRRHKPDVTQVNKVSHHLLIVWSLSKSNDRQFHDTDNWETLQLSSQCTNLYASRKKEHIILFLYWLAAQRRTPYAVRYVITCLFHDALRCVICRIVYAVPRWHYNKLHGH